MNSYERVMAALDGKAVDHLPLMPITMMFAAQQTGAAYKDYALDHRVMVQAQVKTAQTFHFDYVSAISDPAREAADCGAVIRYFDDQPPAIDESCALLGDKMALTRLAVPDPHGGGRMTDRVRAVGLFRERVGGRKIIEGWVEGPCAQAADLRGINALMLDFMDDAGFVRELTAFVVEMELRFATAQMQAGADIIGIGDAAASLVGPEIYTAFIWPMEKKLIDAIHGLGAKVRLHICGNTSAILAAMGQLGADIVDLDYPVSLAEARRVMGPKQTLLGNIDPVRVLKNGSPEGVAAAIGECHRQCGRRYIVGAGCEIPRETPAANVQALAKYAQGAK